MNNCTFSSWQGNCKRGNGLHPKGLSKAGCSPAAIHHRQGGKAKCLGSAQPIGGHPTALCSTGTADGCSPVPDSGGDSIPKISTSARPAPLHKQSKVWIPTTPLQALWERGDTEPPASQSAAEVRLSLFLHYLLFVHRHH